MNIVTFRNSFLKKGINPQNSQFIFKSQLLIPLMNCCTKLKCAKPVVLETTSRGKFQRKKKGEICYLKKLDIIKL